MHTYTGILCAPVDHEAGHYLSISAMPTVTASTAMLHKMVQAAGLHSLHVLYSIHFNVWKHVIQVASVPGASGSPSPSAPLARSFARSLAGSVCVCLCVCLSVYLFWQYVLPTCCAELSRAGGDNY